MKPQNKRKKVYLMPVSSRMFEYTQPYSDKPIKIVQIIANMFDIVSERSLKGDEIISTDRDGNQIFLKQRMFRDPNTGKEVPFESFLNCSKTLVKQFFKQPNIADKFDESKIEFDAGNLKHQMALMNVLIKVKMIIGVNATKGQGRRLKRVLFSSKMIQEGEDFVLDVLDNE